MPAPRILYSEATGVSGAQLWWEAEDAERRAALSAAAVVTGVVGQAHGPAISYTEWGEDGRGGQ
jgi:hypothetical protein